MPMGRARSGGADRATVLQDTETMNTKANEHFEDDEARWRAVAARDRTADGRFIYAVRTTGIYCKPSCAARLPRRTNVTFHATSEEAERLGFRACRRCRPKLAPGNETAYQVVTTAARMIEGAIAGDRKVPLLEMLAARSGFSTFHFHRMFKQALGVTPKAYEAAIRADRAAQSLSAGGTITAAIYDAGYASSSRFYDAAAARMGMTPATRRAGGQGETIRYAIGRTSLGQVLVAETGRGVCAILLGERDADLVRDLEQRFAKARLSADAASLGDRLAAVIALIEKPHRHSIPLDVRGTAFQEQVWQALRAIPIGETATYAEIAAAVGRPKAVRAVAGACAANPAAVAIPCHRVVRSDGHISGYRWGSERKARLLAREGKAKT